MPNNRSTPQFPSLPSSAPPPSQHSHFGPRSTMANIIKFHVAISGPKGITFPSFHVQDLRKDGDIDQITLADIRKECKM